MSLTRRGFLGLLTTAAAGVAIAPELAELLKPRPTIFLPPKGGWASGGRIASGPNYLIGERGPELVGFNMFRVTSVERSDSMLRGMHFANVKDGRIIQTTSYAPFEVGDLVQVESSIMGLGS